MTDEQQKPDAWKAATSRWIDQLVDLTGNNRLLYFRPTAATVVLDPAATPKLFSADTIRLGDLTQPATFDAARTAFQKAIAKARENFEERGLDTLFAGIGSATWLDSASKATPSAPVLLRPLEAAPDSKAHPSIRFDEGWVINPTLLAYLTNHYGVTIDGAQLTEAFLDEDAITAESVQAVMAAMTEAVRTAEPGSGFTISPALVIGNFSYVKLPMVVDLRNAVDSGDIDDHQLLRAMSGDDEARRAVRERLPEVSESEPDSLAPNDEYLILTADSSQSAVINSVLAGADLVVEGPPGTGKSQTIANLIAALAARGERVLFVAEKRAAIDAVVKNLDETGLGGLVLDLHGSKNARAQVARAMSQSLTQLQTALPPTDTTSEPLQRERARLAAHRDAVTREREPWGLSFDAALQKMLDTAPALRIDKRETIAMAGTSTVERLESLAASAQQFAELDGLAVLRHAHPWHTAFTGGKGATDERAQDLTDLAARLYDAFNAVLTRVEQACDELSFRYPVSLDQLVSRARLIDELTDLTRRATAPIDEATLAPLANALEPAAHGAFAQLVARLTDTKFRDALQESRRLLGITDKPRRVHAAIRKAQELLRERKEVGLGDGPVAGFNGEPLALARQSLEQTLVTFTERAGTTFESTIRLPQLQQTITALFDTRDVARRLPQLQAHWKQLTEAGLREYLDAAAAGEHSPSDTRSIVMHALYRSVCESMRQNDSSLVELPGDAHREAVARFTTLDEQHIAATPQRILRNVAEHAVDVRDKFDEQDALIQKQARLQRKHMPVRELLERAPDVATALRPCWAMSPLVVAQILPRTQLFDVVIFDEASQVTPADAIGSFMRAKRAVVAGDRHQLPPTSFWKSQEDEQHQPGDVDAESVLDAIAGLMPDLRGRRMLNWHYRSRDERLIAFSNAQPSLYDWGLNTFADARNEQCLQHVVVPQNEVGVYREGSSAGEVARVVTLIRTHIIEHPDETLGVITMGARHKNAIDDALGEVAKHDAVLRSFMQGGPPNANGMEPFFVKNLETVQGDQRDAIIISIGYAGRNQDGSLNHSFGPLNGDGGERRLNVAVTRAKNRVTLVSAFEAGEVREHEDQKEGVKLLARYVRYAASGGHDLGAQHRPYPPLNPFEVDVKRRLEEAGIPLIAQHGVSGYRIDLAAQDPSDSSRFVLAIECDGASYHARPTVRDRDRLRQAQLERLGWRFCRIWSTDWFNNADAEVARVVAEWQLALASGDSVPAPSQLAAPINGVTAPVSVPTRGIRPSIRTAHSLSAYDDTELLALADWIQSDNVARTIDEIIDEMFEELGFQRRTASAREKLQSLLEGD